MQIFQKLQMRGHNASLREACDLIAQSVSGDWKRSLADEKRMAEMATRAEESWFCFNCSAKGKRAPATVFLLNRGDGTVYVPNIVPAERGHLSYDQYNGIMTEFYERFVKPAAAKTGVDVEISVGDAELEYWMSPVAAKKLRAFSRFANKSTGSSHPSDREVWMEFIVYAHRDKSEFDVSLLHRWLVEVERWSHDIASELADEYELGRDILATADKTPPQS